MKTNALLLFVVIAFWGGVSSVAAGPLYNDYHDYYDEYYEEEVREEVAVENVQVTSRQISQTISTRVLSLFSPRPSVKNITTAIVDLLPVEESEAHLGMSSGDDVLMLGAWGMASYSNFENDKDRFKSSGNVGILMAGVDRLYLDDRLAVGIAGGYESSYFKLKTINEKYCGNGYMLTPYVAYRVTDEFFVKILSGMTFVDYDVSGNVDYSAIRSISDFGGEYSWYVDDWQFSAEAGFTYVNEDANKDYEDVYLGEGRVSAKVGYSVAENIFPYAKMTYHNDIISDRDSEIDNDDLQASIGINMFHDSWVFSAEGVCTFDRENEELYGGSFLVRYEF